MSGADLCRKLGLATQTFHRWKEQVGRLAPDLPRGLTQLRREWPG